MRVWSVMVLMLGTAFVAPAGLAAGTADCIQADRACIRNALEAAASAGDIVAKIDLARMLLDEPEQRLDAHRRSLVADALRRRMAAGCGIGLATHSGRLARAIGADVLTVGEAP